MSLPTYTAPTAAEVKALTGSTLDDALVDSVFIAGAAAVMENACDCLAELPVDTLTMVNLWLAAHMLTQSGVGQSSAVKSEEKFENYSIKRVVGTFSGSGVMGTTYGVQANMLSGGCLQEVDKRQAFVVGLGGAG